jgi:hypothetical protein
VNTLRAVARLLAIAVVGAAAVAACTVHPPPKTTTTTTTAPKPSTGALVEWTRTGGMCPAELCSARVSIAADGRYTVQNGVNRGEGRLDAATTSQLNERVRRELGTLADLQPSRGCPSIYDGNDITYRFTVDGRVTAVSNCTKVIPGDNALLLYTQGIVQQLLARVSARQPVVEWSARGGLCPWGLCQQAVTIYTDNSWHAVNGTNQRDGVLDAAVGQELRARISAEIGSLASLPPSTGGCPSAYDGSDLTYRFTIGGRVTEVSNCTRVVPGDNALLRYVDSIVGPIARSVPSPSGVPG